MSNKKATKRALLTSITALAMCVVMLVGTTFAWFTDTATANVNKIQAGKLDVALEMWNGTDWVTAEGKTLNFVKAPGGENQTILWEPGAEYKLPELRVRNDGNLAIKYEVAITGAVDATPNNGVNDLELLNVITFSASIGGGTATSGVYGTTIATGTLNEKDAEQTIQLSAKMDENAGNKYQEMAISGIAITVKAMQASYEYDSNGNTYDDAADMTPDNLDKRISANVTVPVVSGGDTEISNADKTAVATVPEAAAKDASGELTLKVAADDSAAANVNITSAQAALGYEVEVVGLNTTNTVPVKVELKVGAGLTGVELYHNGNPMAKGTSADSLTDGQYFYNESTGILTFATSTFSPFAVVYDAPTAVIGDTYYDTLAAAFDAAKDGDTITLLKSTNGGGIVAAKDKFATKGLTVNFNGHSYTVGGVLVGSAGTGTNASQLLQGNKITFKNGSFVGVTEGTKPAEDTPDWHGAPAMMIQNYCDLTLDNMIVAGGDETVYTMSNNCGDIVINNTTINAGGAKGYGYGPYAFDVCRYSSYPSVNVTVSGNSIINGDVEVSGTIGAGQDRQLTINGGKFYGKFTVSGNVPANITINGGEFVDLANAVKYAADGATIKLAEDVTIAAMLEFPAEKTMTIDLNGKTITATGNNIGKWAQVYGNVTFKGEGFVGDATNESVGYLFDVRGDGVLNFEGNATYQCGLSIVQMFDNATVNISDGKFVGGSYNGKYWTLNKIDAYRNTTTIKATGGQFYKFDPSNGQTENPADNFVADGFEVIQNGDWFEVVAE